MRTLPLALASLTLVLAGPARAADSAKETVARMQKFYESTQNLHAKFEQELQSAIGGARKASGEVWLKKPGKMRWEYEKPEKKYMIADGASLWVYEPEDEQAFKQSLKTSTLPSSVTFLFGTGKLTDEFTITLADEKPATPGDVALKLVPIKPTAQYRHLVFVVDAKTAMVKETFVYDQQGGVNHMTFRDVVTNQPIPDGKFVFNPPAGTKILHP
jgi:outer membrane lipoprotein carrier protein